MKNKGSNHYFVVILVVSFVIIIIGATFSYFTASARSDSEAVNTASYFVQVDYNDGQSIGTTDLIPSSKEIALFSYHGVEFDSDGNAVYTDNPQCIDDNSRVVCTVYSFDVTNLGNIEQHLGAFITVSSNQFKNLKYVLYNVSDVSDDDSVEDKYNKSIEISTGDFPRTFDDFGYFTYPAVIYVIGRENQVEQILQPGETAKYKLVMWLNETNEVQFEQNFKFSGKMTVSLTDQSHVYGYIEKAQ